MKQSLFEQSHGEFWAQFDGLCLALEKKKTAGKSVHDFVPMYRKLCQHYALAKQRQYGPNLVSSLERRVMRAHRLIYDRKSASIWRLLGFTTHTFPNTLRAHWKHWLLASLLFYVPAVLIGLACYFNGDLLGDLIGGQTQDIESMYEPGEHKIGRTERDSSDDLLMFGYYIKNNISIGLRCFASGVLAGVGTLFSLVFNGLYIGGVAGHLTQLGYVSTFWPFVVGHGSFELTAITVCGAAGLRLGQPLYAPGRHSRSDAFRVAGKDALIIAMGGALMFFVAAFIEAFWSASRLPNWTKYSVGLCLWAFVAWYLLLCGRDKNTQIKNTQGES